MPSLKPEQLDASIRSGSLGPLYVFDGPENWLKEQAIQHIIDRLLPPEARDFNLERLDGKTCSAAQVVSAAQSLPWMAERRVIVVQAADEIGAPEGRIIAEGLSGLPSSTCLVFIYEGKANLREEIPAHAASAGLIVTFWMPFPNQMPAWVASEARRRGKIISHEAALLLADACSDLQQIVNELNKLALYVGAKKTIDIDDIRRHGLPDEWGDFKDLEEAVWARDVAEGLRQGRLLADSGVRAESIFPIFARVFKTLLLGHFLATEKKMAMEDIYAELGIRGKTYQANLLKGLKAYKSEETRRSLSKVVQADYDLKTGALPGPIAVSLLIWNLCGREKAVSAFR